MINTKYIILAALLSLVTFTASAEKKMKVTSSGKVGGHAYVDLGLPSGTLWATCNVGAKHATDTGDYFAWGETEMKDDYFWRSYKFGYKNIYKYCMNDQYGKVDHKEILDDDDDAATVLWGNKWHIPSREQMKELFERLDWHWTDSFEGSGVAGMLGKSKTNGRLLFLPAAGFYGNADLVDDGELACYWTASLAEDTYGAHALHFQEDSSLWKSSSRYCGLPVRAVTYRHER